MLKQCGNLVFIGRPASGKSEFIDYIKKLNVEERFDKFKIGEFEEIDDWPWLWEKFVEDDLWAELGYPRICSKRYENGDIGVDPKHLEIFDLMIKKFNYEISSRHSLDFYKNKTLFRVCRGIRFFCHSRPPEAEESITY